jgi:cytoskeletal protein CcmA (bactofilin family)
VALLFALLPTRVFAAESRQGDTVRIGPNERIADDLYLFGGSIIVEGAVDGDVVAAGNSIVIEGPVSGDVIASGNTITVSGDVRGAVRAAGATVTIEAPVGQDVLAAGGMVEVLPPGQIGRDLWMGTSNGVVNGSVDGDVLARAERLMVSGRVGGDLHAGAGTLRLSDSAIVGGDVTYTADNDDVIASGATVRGQVIPGQPEAAPDAGPVSKAVDLIVSVIRALVGLFLLGAVFVWLFPAFSAESASSIRRSPWVSLGLGTASIVVIPIVAVVIFAAGLFVGGWWLGLIVLALYGIILVLSYVAAGLFAGSAITDRIGRPTHPLGALLLGLLVLTLLAVLPVVGWLTITLAVLVGLGGLALAARNTFSRPTGSATEARSASSIL